MRGGDAPSEREPKTGAAVACRDERFEQCRRDVGRYPRPVVRDDDRDQPVRALRPRDDADASWLGRMHRVVEEGVEKSRHEADVRPHEERRRHDLVDELRAAFREELARDREDVGQRNRLRMRRVSPCKRHEVVDDRVRQPRATLDFGEMRLTTGEILPRQIHVRGDDLKSVSQLVCDLSRDFANRRETFLATNCR